MTLCTDIFLLSVWTYWHVGGLWKLISHSSSSPRSLPFLRNLSHVINFKKETFGTIIFWLECWHLIRKYTFHNNDLHILRLRIPNIVKHVTGNSRPSHFRGEREIWAWEIVIFKSFLLCIFVPTPQFIVHGTLCEENLVVYSLCFHFSSLKGKRNCVFI
jgi:hypothetical protein